MTQIVETIVDVGGRPIVREISFSIPQIRQTATGDMAVMVRHKADLGTDGHLDVDLDPGPAVVHILGHPPYPVQVPEEGPVALWDLVEEGLVIDSAPAGELEAIIDAWLSARVDDIRGEPGRGVDSIAVDDVELVFEMTSGPDERVVVPALSDAADAAVTAVTAAGTATDAAGAATAAAGAAAAAASAADEARIDAVQCADDAGVAAGVAVSSASTAGGHRAAAESSASSANQSAQDAHSDRVAAEAAAVLAGGHAAAASSSETNAGTSESNAAGSAAAAHQSALDAAAVVNDGVPNATSSVKGGILLAGDLAGTWDAPTVPGLADKADLVGGKIPTSQIPAVALTIPVPVFDEAARLALTAVQVQPGDLAIQASPAGTWMLKDPDPSLPGSWVQLVTAESPVQSVNGQTGAVVLGKADVGLGSVDNTADADKPVSSAQQSALDGKVPTSRTITAGTGLTGGGTLAADRSLAVVFGTTAGTACQGNDARLTDARTPTAHQHDADDITSGTLAAARIPTIEKAKLASGVQASLDKADSAVQPGASGSVVVGSLPGSGVTGVLYVVP